MSRQVNLDLFDQNIVPKSRREGGPHKVAQRAIPNVPQDVDLRPRPDDTKIRVVQDTQIEPSQKVMQQGHIAEDASRLLHSNLRQSGHALPQYVKSAPTLAISEFGFELCATLGEYSRYVLQVNVGFSAGKPISVYRKYLDAVSESGHLPQILQNDPDVETAPVGDAHWELRRASHPEITQADGYSQSRSTNDSHLVHWWSQASKLCLFIWNNVLSFGDFVPSFLVTIPDVVILIVSINMAWDTSPLPTLTFTTQYTEPPLQDK
ncbi:uncharacterized protein N7496_009064 [Penicillium cataractarum]|uniref:Uncharacterized protein n=1 Tax=Penicillium cataractarum TaxID=2100454 RepID=A0A9W9S2A2_9EURO|nr:uncharacterized protein N7496_009064 [Penicillium cataractarum]KAJ5369304.1 hypothetical protein N7496_009064 [Penicillium cataractarum]